MALVLVTAPSASDPVVTRAEAKAFMRIPTTFVDDDTLIDALIAGAVGEIDGERGWLNRALVSQTWDLVLDRFPQAGDRPDFVDAREAEAIIVPLPPLQSITHIKYVDTAGTTQTLAATDYTVDAKSEPGRITSAWGKFWPSTRDVVNAVEVRLVAGYGAASTVPEVLKTALKMLVLDAYQNPSELTRLRHADVERWYRRDGLHFPPHIRRLLRSFKVP